MLADLFWPLLGLAVLLALAAGGVAAVNSRGRSLALLLGLGALVLAVATAGLVSYVAGEDDYRRNGISRWDAYDAHEVTIAAVVLSAIAVATVGVVLRRRSRSKALLAGLTILAASVLQAAAYLANSLN